MAVKEEVRFKVAKHYCKTVAAIDDAIFEDRSERKLNPLFLNVLEGFEKAGSACHLFSFGNSADEELNDLERAKSLSARADLTLLDWSMGKDKDSKYAKEILRYLNAQEELQVVVIFTDNPDLGSIETELKGDELSAKPVENVRWENPADLGAGPEALVDGVPIRQVRTSKSTVRRPRFLRTEGDVCILVAEKPEGDFDAERLLRDVFALLNAVYVDHLHWAALEVATRARGSMPAVIASLPSNTDVAVTHQLLYQEEGGVPQQMVEIILDELRFQLRAKPLSAVTDEIVFDDLKEGMIRETAPAKIEILLDAVRGLTGIAKNKWPAVPVNALEKWKAADIQKCRADIAAIESNPSEFFLQPRDGSSLRKLMSNVLSIYVGKALQRDQNTAVHAGWARARESVLVPYKDRQPVPGLVLRDTTAKAGNGFHQGFLLCVAPACDCARPEKPLAFVRGKAKKLSQNPGESKLSETQSCVGEWQIIWDAKEIEMLEVAPISDKYEIIGVLREEFISRIVQRLWSYQSRIGVDTSEYLRQLRAE